MLVLDYNQLHHAWQVGERERIQAAEDALARRRRVVAKLEAQASCQAQQQRAFARVSFATASALLPHALCAAQCCFTSAGIVMWDLNSVLMHAQPIAADASQHLATSVSKRYVYTTL